MSRWANDPFDPKKHTVEDFQLSGSLIANKVDAIATANTNILTQNYISNQNMKTVLRVMTDTAGIISLIDDGKSGKMNLEGAALTAGLWYEFEITMLTGGEYNLQMSTNATVQIKWIGGI